MSEKKRLQISVNAELHKTLMSISKTSRGQFVNMALNKFIQTEEGQHLLREFASYQPDTEQIERELREENSSSRLDSIMGEF